MGQPAASRQHSPPRNKPPNVRQHPHVFFNTPTFVAPVKLQRVPRQGDAAGHHSAPARPTRIKLEIQPRDLRTQRMDRAADAGFEAAGEQRTDVISLPATASSA